MVEGMDGWKDREETASGGLLCLVGDGTKLRAAVRPIGPLRQTITVTFTSYPTRDSAVAVRHRWSREVGRSMLLDGMWPAPVEAVLLLKGRDC